MEVPVPQQGFIFFTVISYSRETEGLLFGITGNSSVKINGKMKAFLDSIGNVEATIFSSCKRNVSVCGLSWVPTDKVKSS